MIKDGPGIDPAALAAAIVAGALTLYGPPGPWALGSMPVGGTLLLLLFGYDGKAVRSRIQSWAFAASVGLAATLMVGYPLEVAFSGNRVDRLAAMLREKPQEQSHSDVPPVLLAFTWGLMALITFRADRRRSKKHASETGRDIV